MGREYRVLPICVRIGAVGVLTIFRELLMYMLMCIVMIFHYSGAFSLSMY